MHHAARVAPGTRSARHPAAAVLTAVVLTLLVALGLAGPATTGGPAADVAAAAGHRLDAGSRADEGCDTLCVLRAAARQEPHHEHPAPRCHLAVRPQGTNVAPPGCARFPTPSRRIPSSRSHAHHDRGRAPPATSGT
ncbi:hypothetical protein ABZ446_27600 [Streptomyces sp. NPDC005813]|uniref:hypothetical protein n=1 Tax=Streptomyces sp. NPDC005813 TaxID=3155592 RepID=UPI0033C547DC